VIRQLEKNETGERGATAYRDRPSGLIRYVKWDSSRSTWLAIPMAPISLIRQLEKNETGDRGAAAYRDTTEQVDTIRHVGFIAFCVTCISYGALSFQLHRSAKHSLFLPGDVDMVQNLKITCGHIIKSHWDVFGSNFGLDTDCHDWDYSTYFTISPGKQAIIQRARPLLH
jgi:hypothetical protein